MNAEIPPEKYFYACDGSVIRSIEELFEALQDMPDHVFQYHVNGQKNDFQDWIAHVFQDTKLAGNIKNSKDSEDMLKHVFVSLFR